MVVDHDAVSALTSRCMHGYARDARRHRGQRLLRRGAQLGLRRRIGDDGAQEFGRLDQCAEVLEGAGQVVGDDRRVAQRECALKAIGGIVPMVLVGELETFLKQGAC